MPLHIDFRPSTFDEVVGNQTTIETIKNKIYGSDPPHAILLHGPSGCGKTTLARIIAQELGCNVQEKSNDFVELDIAQLSGVDTAREIRQNMSFLPFDNGSKCRVWLLDEFHKASNSFQNGMLKALEDPPNHVFFILATTEKNKIINTVLTRCTQFKVELLIDKQIEELINWILKEEDLKISKDVMHEIIEAAEGCPREAVKILDQIIDLEPDKMVEAIQQTEAAREVKELCQAMLKGADWNKLRKILKELKGADPERARQAVIYYMQAVAWNSPAQADRCALIFDCFRETVFYTGMPGITFAAYNTTL